MVDPGDRISVSVGQSDVRAIEKFDRYFEAIDDPYSRAERIREAMRLYRALHETVVDMDGVTHPDEMGDMQFRAYVQQAIYDLDGRDRRAEAIRADGG